MSVRPKAGSSLCRRARRLTLAPSKAAALSPHLPRVQQDERPTEQQCREARLELSKFVALVADATPCPQKHAVPISSKFWAQGDEADESEDEEPQSPTTPEFLKDAVEAGFTVEQLLRAERALASGNKSPDSTDLLLSKEIVSTLVSRKKHIVPWSGPLPKPRISPPTALGDCVAAVLPKSKSCSIIRSHFQGSSLTCGRSSLEDYLNVGKTCSPSVQILDEGNCSNSKFESFSLEGKDPHFPSLIWAAAKGTDYAAVDDLKTDSNSFEITGTADSASTQTQTGLASWLRHGAKEKRVNRDTFPDRIKLGPGRFFRPTKGLIALLSRTGSLCKKKENSNPNSQPPPSSTRHRTFAQVVREGSMAAQGRGDGSFGNHGGGDHGFNPGFHPGFNPGYGGRGRGFQPRGRG